MESPTLERLRHQQQCMLFEILCYSTQHKASFVQSLALADECIQSLVGQVVESLFLQLNHAEFWATHCTVLPCLL